MSKQILYLVLTLFPVFLTIPTYGVEPAARITDREIIEALADLRAGQKALEKRIEALEKRMDGIEKRIDFLQEILLAGFSTLLIGMMTLIGFVLWDRRTALAPAIRKNRELEERGERLEKALKEYARQEPKLTQILRSFGLL
jgi:chaperonin cofactor prefoldin